MKARLFILYAGIILLGITTGRSFGQTSGGIGFFAPGIHTISYSKLGNSLPAGYPEIKSKPLVTAGLGYGIFWNIVLGGEGGTMHAGTFTEGNQQVDLTGDFGFFSLGYVVVNRNGFLLFPSLSIGSNDLMMYIHEKDHTATFGSITGEPFQATTLHYKTSMAKVSLTGVYPLQGNKPGKGSAGFMLGIQAGYQFGYKEGDWSYDAGTVTDGPDFNSNGFFIQLLIGGGGVFSK